MLVELPTERCGFARIHSTSFGKRQFIVDVSDPLNAPIGVNGVRPQTERRRTTRLSYDIGWRSRHRDLYSGGGGEPEARTGGS